ncbi:MAG: ATP-binding protein [Clostridia bacterium]|nr:ATP-binding protein [Clostridia bacterium]
MSRETLRFVITGGPCAGKTTAMERIKQYFEDRDYCVVFIPETATELICSGITPWTMDSKKSYQKHQMMLQSEKERVYLEAAQHIPKGNKIIALFDRGLMDNKAYLTDDEYSQILTELSLTEPEILARYDAVFHLVTAAKCKNNAYTLSNNSARTETPEQARVLDDRLLEVWKNHQRRCIIENSNDFDEKINNLIECITAYLS